jgi:hypothetical protein
MGKGESNDVEQITRANSLYDVKDFLDSVADLESYFIQIGSKVLLRNIYFSSKNQRIIDRIDNYAEPAAYIVVKGEDPKHCKYLATALVAAAHKNKPDDHSTSVDYLQAEDHFYNFLHKFNKHSNHVIDRANKTPQEWITKFDQWLIEDENNFIYNNDTSFQIISLINSPGIINSPNNNVSGSITFKPMSRCLFNLDENFKKDVYEPLISADTLIVGSFFQEPLSDNKSFKDFYQQDSNKANDLIEKAYQASGYFRAYLDRFYADALIQEFTASKSAPAVFLEHVHQLLIEFSRNKEFK